MQQLDAQLRGVVREPRSDGGALELDVLVIVDAKPNVDAFDRAREIRPAAAQIDAALVEIDSHRLLFRRGVAGQRLLLVRVGGYSVQRVERGDPYA